jgi:hypothetical protein
LRGWGEREGAEWVVREGVGAYVYAHMNNKTIKKNKKPQKTYYSTGW